MEEDIAVSIICNTYNHEKFIRQALESFIMQKTNFKFEILVHDDASTDNTASIIRELEEKYPDVVKPIYQTENQYSKHIPGLIAKIQYGRVKGKYIALCEGDDFWSSEYKLQSQFDALENNLDCVMCTVIVEETDETGNKNENKYPDTVIRPGKIAADDMIKLMTSKHSYPFQTSGYFFRADIAKEYHNEMPDFRKKASVGDVPLMMYFMTKGDLFFINKPMSCYRRNMQSWSYRNNKTNNILKKCETIKNHIGFYNEFDRYSNFKYHDYIKEYVERAESTIAWMYIENNYYREAIKKPYIKYIESKKTRLLYRLHVYAPWIVILLRKAKVLKN